MTNIAFIFGVIFLSICIYQLNRVKLSESTSKAQSKWISVVMALFSLPILKMLDRILGNLGMQSEFAFYLSILILLVLAFAIHWTSTSVIRVNKNFD